MELRREAALKVVKAEPQQLKSLQTEVREKDGSSTFFESRVRQARQKLTELMELAPASENEVPTFTRTYKLRSEAEKEAIVGLEKAVTTAENGEEVDTGESTLFSGDAVGSTTGIGPPPPPGGMSFFGQRL
jgi:hypothetical protein